MNPFVTWQMVRCIQGFVGKDASSLEFVRVVPIAKVSCIQGSLYNEPNGSTKKRLLHACERMATCHWQGPPCRNISERLTFVSVIRTRKALATFKYEVYLRKIISQKAGNYCNSRANYQNFGYGAGFLHKRYDWT